MQYYEIVSVQSQLVSIQKQRNTGLLLENMYFYRTYSIMTKILSMLASIGYFLKIAKNNSQQQKPICTNRKN